LQDDLDMPHHRTPACTIMSLPGACKHDYMYLGKTCMVIA
jgi:hypothetical protein